MIEWIIDNWGLLLSIVGAGAAISGALYTFTRARYRWRRTKHMRRDSLDSMLIIRSFGTISKRKGKRGDDEREEKKPEWYEVLQAELDRLPLGKVVFNPPDTMKLGVKERIETRISKDVNADLISSLRGRGIPQTEVLKISELMKVRLSGDDFGITPLNEELQIIEATGFTEWAWDVTPTKSGQKVLYLHVTLRIRMPFGEETKDHPILERRIVVLVNPIYSMKCFVQEYWKWIVTALILPLLGWALKTYLE